MMTMHVGSVRWLGACVTFGLFLTNFACSGTTLGDKPWGAAGSSTGTSGAAGSGAGGPAGAGGNAGSSSPQDGSTNAPDVSVGGGAGTPGAEASTPGPDAPSVPPTIDVSSPPPAVDAGSPSSDAGARTDSGNPPGDVGNPPVDAGPPTSSSGCGATTWPANGNFTIDVAGAMRAYIVKIPAAYDTNKPYKLVFAWHGLGGTAQQIAQFGYYQLESPSAGSAIFVSGQGLETGSGAGWPNTNGQDVAFVRALVDAMKKSYCIDEKRIFSVGMSYGGIMSNTLGCQMGGIFRAIAPMAGSGPSRFGGNTCTGQVAAWLAHGTQDTVVTFAAGQASRDFWRGANHCSDASVPASPAACVSYEGCDPGFPVHWCQFDGGHTIPSFSGQAIWNFFLQF